MHNEQHTSKQYDAELEQIRAEVLSMGRLVERQLIRAIEAFRRQDAQLAGQVIAADVDVNTFEVAIDELCTTVIARRQPASNDLRLMTMVLKTITDLERIGDEAKKISLTTRNMLGRARIPPSRISDLGMVSDLVVNMLQRSLDVFARLDFQEAPSMARRDLEVDQYFQAILRQLLTYMIEDPRTISASLDVVFIAKSLERIGDHATNIAEYVVYMIKGTDVRHVTLEELEQVVRS